MLNECESCKNLGTKECLYHADSKAEYCNYIQKDSISNYNDKEEKPEKILFAPKKHRTSFHHPTTLPSHIRVILEENYPNPPMGESWISITKIDRDENKNNFLIESSFGDDKPIKKKPELLKKKLSVTVFFEDGKYKSFEAMKMETGTRRPTASPQQEIKEALIVPIELEND
jgi:hypothetical protein